MDLDDILCSSRSKAVNFWTQYTHEDGPSPRDLILYASHMYVLHVCMYVCTGIHLFLGLFVVIVYVLKCEIFTYLTATVWEKLHLLQHTACIWMVTCNILFLHDKLRAGSSNREPCGF